MTVGTFGYPSPNQMQKAALDAFTWNNRINKDPVRDNHRLDDVWGYTGREKVRGLEVRWSQLPLGKRGWTLVHDFPYPAGGVMMDMGDVEAIAINARAHMLPENRRLDVPVYDASSGTFTRDRLAVVTACGDGVFANMQVPQHWLPVERDGGVRLRRRKNTDYGWVEQMKISPQAYIHTGLLDTTMPHTILTQGSWGPWQIVDPEGRTRPWADKFAAIELLGIGHAGIIDSYQSEVNPWAVLDGANGYIAKRDGVSIHPVLWDEFQAYYDFFMNDGHVRVEGLPFGYGIEQAVAVYPEGPTRQERPRRGER